MNVIVGEKFYKIKQILFSRFKDKTFSADESSDDLCDAEIENSPKSKEKLNQPKELKTQKDSKAIL